MCVLRWMVPGMLVLAMACGGDAGDAGPEGGEEAGAAAQGSEGGAAGGEAGAATSGNNWIEYTVTGEVEGSGRDDEVMMCSTTGEDFLARSLGDWILDFEVPGSGAAGEHQGRITLAAPEEALPVGGDPRGDRRLRGAGTVRIEDVGRDAMGMRVVEVEYSGDDLVSGRDVTASVSGSFRCPVLAQG